MSLQSTKSHLIQLLSEVDNKVIALSGKWGTGKSHLWREVMTSSSDQHVKNAFYVSLFGLSDMNQIKLKIVQSAIPNAQANSASWEETKRAFAVIRKGLETIHKGFSVLSDLPLLAVPLILKNKVIVLDDIERKHAKLNIDEVLGFIDELTQQHGARVVLILNSDQLTDKSAWDTLREKVVDQEIRLDTSPADAFQIAIGLTSSAYSEHIKKTIETCRVTNIRIIGKVIRAVNRILGNRQNMSDAVIGRVIPSTVLLAAIHYKGIEDGPDFDFVLSVRGRDLEGLDDDDKRRAKWKLLLNELRIHNCDDFEMLVVEYLQSGLFEVGAVTKIIDRYIAEAEVMRVQQSAQQLYEHIVWHHKMTDEELLVEARELAKEADRIDAYNVTYLHELISGIAGGGEVADTMVSNWIAAFQSQAGQQFNDDNLFQRRIHPLIKAELDAAKNKVQAKTTVFDACADIAKNTGWGTRHEVVMKSASIKDFEETIKALDASDLRLFMCRFLDFCIHRETYKQHFGSAMDNFTEACRNICAQSQVGRLAILIRRLFDDAKLGSSLNPTGLGV